MRDPPRRPRASLRELYAAKNVLVAGPMVRYSKLPFRETVRELVRRFSPEQRIVVYTPMILAREFARNSVARMGDFTTSATDAPLLVQFGSANAVDLARACLLVQPHCDGVGLNCGCPIPEQCREGVGAALMTKPHLVAEMVRAVKRACGAQFFVEVKIRIHTDLATTERFARIVEAAGADAVCVHGRRRADRSGNVPVNLEAIARVKNAVSIPVIANGDFRTPRDLHRILETGVDGVMAARGVLANPALFCGQQFTTCPWSAVEILWDHAMASGLPFQLILHHMVEMFKGRGDLAKLRKELVTNNTTFALINWFDANFDLKRRGESGFGERIEWPTI